MLNELLLLLIYDCDCDDCDCDDSDCDDCDMRLRLRRDSDTTLAHRASDATTPSSSGNDRVVSPLKPDTGACMADTT